MYKQYCFTACEKLEIKRALGSDFLPSVRAYQLDGLIHGLYHGICLILVIII